MGTELIPIPISYDVSLSISVLMFDFIFVPFLCNFQAIPIPTRNPIRMGLFIVCDPNFPLFCQEVSNRCMGGTQGGQDDPDFRWVRPYLRIP